MRVKDDTAAHLQLLLILLARGEAAEAAPHAEALQGNLGDRGLEALLLGRVRFAMGKLAAAEGLFARSLQQDPRRTDALVWQGATSARSRQREAALDALSRALQRDPGRAVPPPADARFFLLEGDTLRGAEGHLSQLRTQENDILPPLYEGYLRYLLGDVRGAKEQLEAVLKVDEENGPALALNALLALADGRTRGECQGLAGRAVRDARHLALAHYSLGLCEASLGHVEQAQPALRQALVLNPALGSAEVALARLEPAAAARPRLLRLLERDPGYVEAEQALFALSRRGGSR
jgi:tetratricopeptide (TPR) repeat protein